MVATQCMSMLAGFCHDLAENYEKSIEFGTSHETLNIKQAYSNRFKLGVEGECESLGT